MISMSDADTKYAAVWLGAGGDTIKCVHELSLKDDGHRRLVEFVNYKHGKELIVPWPRGWMFTFVSRRRSDLKKNVDVNELRSRLCCETRLTIVGVVHHVSVDSWRSDSAVILIGVSGTVYMYDRIDMMLSLVAPEGFGQFFDMGLWRVHRFRTMYKLPECEEEEGPFASMARACTNCDVLKIRDAYIGHETILFQKDDAWSILKICDRTSTSYKEEDVARWVKQISTASADVLFKAKTWMDGGWLDIVIIASWDGDLFAIDPVDERIHFIARSVREFFNIGLLRFRNNFVYRLNLGYHLPAVFGPTGCPRGMCGGQKTNASVCRSIATSLQKMKRSWK
nr:MAG: protein m43 [Herpesviridae sp.]